MAEEMFRFGHLHGPPLVSAEGMAMVVLPVRAMPMPLRTIHAFPIHEKAFIIPPIIPSRMA